MIHKFVLIVLFKYGFFFTQNFKNVTQKKQRDRKAADISLSVLYVMIINDDISLLDPQSLQAVNHARLQDLAQFNQKH